MRSYIASTTIILATLLLAGGCSKETGQSIPSAAITQTDAGGKGRPHRPALVLLSAQEVAKKLENHAASFTGINTDFSQLMALNLLPN